MDEEVKMNPSQIKSNQKNDGFLEILKESRTFLCKNTNFIIFSIIASLPMFIFLVYFELILQKTFMEATTLLKQHNSSSYFYYPDDNQRFSSTGLASLTIQFCLLYLFPYHLLDLLNMIIVVDTASMVYAEEEKQWSVKELVKKSIKRLKLKGPFLTSIYVLLFSTSALLGLIWVVTNFFVFSKIYSFNRYYDYYYYYDEDSYFNGYRFRKLAFDLLSSLLHVAAFTALLVKLSEWSAGWNMSLIVSVLEESSYGSEAFEVSGYFGRGSNGRGMYLMLVFFVWGFALRLPCLASKCNERSRGIVFTCVYVGLICAGNVVKWVVCLLYFYDCKKRVLEKKIDEEIGKDAKVVDV